MKKENTCEFSDILNCAVTLGYTWNQAHDILVKANICAMYGAQHVYKEDLDEIENEDAHKIIEAFFKQEKVTNFLILPKSS